MNINKLNDYEDKVNQFEQTFGPIPISVNYSIRNEPSRVPHKKWVINNETDKAIDIVGVNFPPFSHPEFFYPAGATVIEGLGVEDTRGAQCKWRTARNNAWVMFDVMLPNVRVRIETAKHSTEVAQRIIMLHGIDGSCSNQVFYGGIESFCTNGQIEGDYAKVRRKNTSKFSMPNFVEELRQAKENFHTHGKRMQKWAETSVATSKVEAMLKALLKSDRKTEKMMSLYRTETSVRGQNMYALYSAFTNYSTYADERNGFTLRQTGNDTSAISMWRREQDVSKWVSSQEFKALELQAA